MSLSDYLVSLIRTLVPMVVGYVIRLTAGADIEVDPGALEVVVSGLFVGGYYALVRALEARFPVVGVLLGWMAKPKYDKAAA